MSGNPKRPISRLAFYSGPKNRYLIAFNKANDDFKSGEITRQQLAQQVKEINKKQVQYMDGLAKALEKRVFMKQQAQAFQREFEKEQKRLEKERQREEKERMDRESQKRVDAQVAKEREKRLASEKKRKEAREARKAQGKKELTNFRNTVIYDKTLTRSEFYAEEKSGLYRAGQKLAGQDSFYLHIIRYGDETSDWKNEIIDLGDLKDKPNDIYYDGIQHYIERYETSVFAKLDDEKTHPTARIIISKATTLPSKRIQQSFRDGEKHCVLDPLISLFTTYYENATNKSSQKTYRCIIKTLNELLEEFQSGVPEESMEHIAKACHRMIIMYDVLGNEVKVWNKKSSKKFHFTNTRENHLDVGHITLDKQYTRVSIDELKQILLDHDTNNVFYLYKMYEGQPQSIRSKNGAWAVFNEDYDIYQKFNETIGLKHFRFNAIKYPIVNDFIKEARIIHSSPVALCDNPNDLEGVSNYDMSKAYTQHAVSPYFMGFLGHIQQWSKLTGKGLDFVRNHLGMFRFRVIHTVELLQKLGMFVDKEYTLPSAEILYMCDVLGLRVELIAGVWGSHMDFEYTPEMLEKGRYAQWAGKLGMEKKHDCYMFKGSQEWASHLKSEIGEDRVAYYDGFIRIKNAKSRLSTTHHLFANITSYNRINMLEMMRRVDGELVKVVLDEVYFRGSMDTNGLNVTFKDNKQLKQHNFTDGWYHESNTDISSWIEYDPTFDGSCVLAGAGGTGKTYSIYHNLSINQPLYVAPTHALGKAMSKQYGCQYTTIHKFIGLEVEDKKCRSYKDDYCEPPIAFVDENTMMAKEWIEKAITMYPRTRLYIAGDMDGKQWYQCRNGKPEQFSEIWMPSRDEWRYVDFTKDMRSLDDELRIFKEEVRAIMRNVFTNGNEGDAKRINELIRKQYKTISFDDAVKMFSLGDIWIAGTHKTNDKLLEAGVVSGWINNKKEVTYAEKPTTIGEWVEEKEGKKCGSFTCHSFQGKTIENKRTFVSLDTFEYAMFYTAISRVRHFDQLVIVN